MKPLLAALLVICAEVPAWAQDADITLPSGRVVAFNEVVHNTQGSTGRSVRFRFLEADLAAVVAAVPYEDLEADMHFLCETYALARISNIGPRPAQIVISISDRPVEFGAADPDATQVFEAYRPEGGACIWEGF